MTLSPSRSFKVLPGSSDDNAKPVFGAQILSWVLLGFGKSTTSKLLILVIMIVTSIVIYMKLSSTIQPIQETVFSADSYIIPSASSQLLTQQWLMHASFELKDHAPVLLTNQFDSYDTAVNIWDVFPPTLNCPDMQRIGKVGEGGKWMCALQHLRSLPSCIMYSFGISTDISFEVEIALKTKCTIYAFDPTIGRLPYDELPIHLKKQLTSEIRVRIIFHKVALNVMSGQSLHHSLNMHFYDIMATYNHSFINLLKVDIEGGEWNIFSQLYNSSHTKGLGGLPVGQLLIELHHQTPIETSHFFRVMHSFGLLPFSREINLIPCISGGMPFAVEYSFINPKHYFHGPSLFHKVSLSTRPPTHFELS